MEIAGVLDALVGRIKLQVIKSSIFDEIYIYIIVETNRTTCDIV